MRLLLDTHIFLWCLKDDVHLTKAIRSKLSQASEVYVSSASIWEAVIKIKLKKLDVEIEKLVEGISTSGFTELPITANHAMHVSQLPDIHRDPFDRMLLAQALSEPLIFLTADPTLKSYSDLVVCIN